MPGGAGESSEAYDLDDFVAGQVTLKDHLDRQIPFTVTSETERLIARHLTDMLDENGYLGAEADELAARLNARPEDVETVLSRLQELDPPGVYARSLSECLAIQLRLKDRLDPAMSALLANLELLARRDFASLKKICGVDEEDLLDMLGEIRRSIPNPASSFESAPSESIIPDVIVKAASDGGWTVEINPDTLPRVLVNQTYYEKVAGSVAKQSADHAFLNECLQNANWLTRSLDQRAKTIMKVATEIVAPAGRLLRPRHRPFAASEPEDGGGGDQDA